MTLLNLLTKISLFFLGRIDNVINSGGIKLLPEQIEEKLAGKIEPCYFISSKEDKELGENCFAIEGNSFDVDKSI
jgi:O-succinylbenzoic acid--CoA ligase